jgi:hypothetical protein
VLSPMLKREALRRTSAHKHISATAFHQSLYPVFRYLCEKPYLRFAGRHIVLVPERANVLPDALERIQVAKGLQSGAGIGVLAPVTKNDVWFR